MQATDVKLEDMSLDELNQLEEMLGKEIHERTKEERKEKRKQMKELARELGYHVEKPESPNKGTGRKGRPPKNPQPQE